MTNEEIESAIPPKDKIALTCDVDGSGFIDVHELSAGLDKLGIPAQTDDELQVFRHVSVRVLGRLLDTDDALEAYNIYVIMSYMVSRPYLLS